jgi:hypothetical protein
MVAIRDKRPAPPKVSANEICSPEGLHAKCAFYDKCERPGHGNVGKNLRCHCPVGKKMLCSVQGRHSNFFAPIWFSRPSLVRRRHTIALATLSPATLQTDRIAKARRPPAVGVVD